MPPRIVTPANAQHLSRVRVLGEKPPLAAFRGQTLAFDARGHQLVSVGRELGTSLRWWDLRQDSPAPQVRHPLERGRSAAFLPEGDALLSLDAFGLLQQWSVSDGALQREARLDLFLSTLSLASTGELALITDQNGVALLWDVSAWRALRALDTVSMPLRCGALSPDGTLAVTGSDRAPATGSPGRVHFWDVATGAPRGTVEPGSASVNAVAFDRTGGLLAAGTSLGDVCLVDVASQTVLKMLRGPASGIVSLSFHPDGALLAVGGGMAGFVVIDTRDGTRLYNHSDENEWQASTATFSPDGRLLAWGQGDGTVGLWAVAD